MELLKEEIRKKQEKIEKYRELTPDLRFWKKIQMYSERGYNIIFPPLSCPVHEMCCKLLEKKHILWIGGAPGAGKTTCTKRFQDYGFMALDSEDRNFNRPFPNLKGLQTITEKANNELNTSFVFGAGCGKFLQGAPDYVYPILILPDQNVYTMRWRNRNLINQNQQKYYNEDLEIAKNNKNILVLNQPIEESVDTTIYRICELVINNQK